MSRWLALARNEIPTDKLTKPTKAAAKLGDGGKSGGSVGSVSFVGASVEVSGTFPRLAYSSTDADDDALALAAIEGGDRTYGAVATTTGMGASRAWRAWERLRADGLLKETAEKQRNPQ